MARYKTARPSRATRGRIVESMDPQDQSHSISGDSSSAADLPTQEEIDQVVSNLAQLANRPEELPSVQATNGGVAVDLGGGFGGVMLARPGSDGGFEMKCVFSLEEGAEFLGLVEETSAE